MNKTSLQRRHCERERPSRGLRILPQDFSFLHLASQGCYSVHSTWLQRHWGVSPNKSKATHFEMLDRNYKRISQTLPEKRSSSDWKHRKTLCHSRRNIVFSDYTLRVCYMNKIPDCLEKQAHYSSINIQDKKEGEATFSKEWFQGV